MFGEEFAEAFDGPADAFLRRVVGRTERRADFAEGFILEVTKHDGATVRLIQRIHSLVQQTLND